MGAAKVWALYDAVTGHLGGCAICGDDDDFSPDIEAFEETEMLICSECYASQCEAVADD